MNLMDLPKMWVQYQNWLKQNGITMDNIQEKMPALLTEIRKDPAKAQQLQNFLESDQAKEIAHKMKLTDEQINEMSNSISTPSSILPRTGNLSLEQMEMLRKYKKR